MSIEDSLYGFLQIYKKMPDWMKVISTLPFRIFKRERFLGKKYHLFYNEAINLEYETENNIAEFQFNRLKKILIKAYSSIPYYHETWQMYGIDLSQIQSFEDFSSRIPFVTKEDVQKFPKKFLSTNYKTNEYLLTNTGGSTGIPLSLYYLRGHSRIAERAYWDMFFHRIGFTPSARIARLRGDYIGKKRLSSFDPYRNTLILSSFEINEKSSIQFINELQAYKVEYITAYPSSLLNLIDLYTKNTVNLPFLRGIMLGSENIFDFQVTRIKDFFGIEKIFKGYGHGEMTAAAGNSSKCNNYHFHPGYGYVEFIKSNISENDHQLSEIVGSSFINPLMPLIRYKTSDYGIVQNLNCSCGRNHKTLREIEGREQEIAVGKNNERITLTALIFARHLDYFKHIAKMQIVNLKPGELIVRVVPKSNFSNLHEKEIIKSLSEEDGMPFSAKIEIVDQIEPTKRGKHRFLIRKF